MLDNYYNRFDPEKHYDKILFRPGKGLQSAELNELQDQHFFQSRGISDSLMKDGDVIAGGDLVIDQDTGLTKIGNTSVYIQGHVRHLKAHEMTVPTDVVLYIGIWLKEEIVTELEDPGLRDPATGTRNYQEPGAARLQMKQQWGLIGQFQDGLFYPVFRIDHGVHILKVPPPELDSISVAIARYDRDSKGGDYVVRGMEVIWQGIANDHEVYSITEGLVHIQGFSISFATSIRKVFPHEPDTRQVNSEPHLFKPDTNGRMRVNLAFSPAKEIQEINVLLSTSADINRGGVSGGQDPLPNVAVFRIDSISQNGNQFDEGVDFNISGNTIDWSPNGNEPAPGSTYQIVYEYRDNVDPIDPDEDGFTIENVVEDSLITIRYAWVMPRIDAITLDKEGIFRRIKGIASPFRPASPSIPNGQFLLAEVHQTWRENTAPEVVNNMVRTVSMDELTRMQQQISDLYDLVSIERLKTNAGLMEPGTKKGVFVDPFLDDDMRDMGIAQTALIMDGELGLPIDEEILDLENVDQIQTLEYDLDTLLSQPMHTGSMKVNPYQSFEPIPPKVQLIPQVDNWTTTINRWLPDSNASRWSSGNRVQTSVRSVSSQSSAATFLRPRSVKYRIEGFGPGEELILIRFDGVNIYEGGQTT